MVSWVSLVAALRIGEAIEVVIALVARIARCFTALAPGKECFACLVCFAQHILKHLGVNSSILFSDVFDVRQLVGLLVGVDDVCQPYGMHRGVPVKLALYNSLHLSTVQVRACTCFLVGYTLNVYACLDMLFLQSLIFLLNQAGSVSCILS